MSTKQIIGIIALVIGIGLYFLPDNDFTGFISGMLIGIGIGLLLTGINRKSRN